MNRLAFINEKKSQQSPEAKAKTDDEPQATNPSTPINVLDGDLAHVYSNLHPLLVLTLYFFRFNAIVKDPISTLTTLLAPLGILQIVYVVLCLPPTGNTSTPAAAKAPTKAARGRKPQGKGDGGAASRTVVRPTCPYLSFLKLTINHSRLCFLIS